MRRGSHQYEQHRFRVHLLFHQLKLNVKFSCKIALSVKHPQNKVHHQTLPRLLTQGECQIGQEFFIDWECQYDASKREYSDSMMEIDIYVHSAKGIIHGGICNIDITRNFSKQLLSLKKCSDKTATLTVTCSSDRSQTIVQKQKSHKQITSPYYELKDSPEKKISRVRSDHNILSPGNDSFLSISKISISSNSRLEKFLRSQNDQLMGQNDILKQKVKSCERRERQLFQQLKDVTIKCDKLSNKYSEVEGLNQLNQMLIIEKDKNIKQFQHQLRQYEGQLDDYVSQIRSLERKLEFKDESTSGREERVHEKMNRMDKQLQEEIRKHIDLLSRYEEREREITLVLRQKDRQFQSEKSKLMHQIAEKSEEIEQMIAEKKTSKKQNEQSMESQKTEKIISPYKNVIQKQNEQMDKLNRRILNLEDEKIQIQLELAEVKRSQQDRLPLKKKINEAQVETTNIKLQSQRVSQALSFSQSKVQQLHDKLSHLETEKRRMTAQIQSLRKKNRQREEIHYKLERQFEAKSLQVKQIKNQLKGEIRKKEQDLLLLREQKSSVDQQLQMLTFHKIKLEYQNNDYREEQFNFNRTIKENTFTISSLEDQLQYVERQIVTLEQQNQTYRKIEEDLRNQIISLKLQESNKDRKIVVLREELKVVKESINSQRNKELEVKFDTIRECQMLNNQVIHLQQAIKQIQDKYHHSLDQMQQQKHKQQILKRQLKDSQDENLELKNHLFELQTSISVLNQQKGNISLNMNIVEQKLQKKEKQFREVQEKCVYLTAEAEALGFRDSQLGQYTSALEKESQEYQIATAATLEYIFFILKSQSEEQMKKDINLPSEQLREQLQTSLNKRNQNIRSQIRKYDYLKEQKQFFQQEIVKVGQELFDQNMEYQQSLKRSKDDRKKMIKEFQQQNNQLLQTIDYLKNLQSESKVGVDNYFRHSKDLEHTVLELQKEVLHLKDINIQLQQKLANEQKEVVQLNKKYHILHRKSSVQKKMQEDHTQTVLGIEKERLKIQVETLKRIGKKRQEDLKNLTERNKSLQEKLLRTDIDNKKGSFDLSVQQHIFEEMQAKYTKLCSVKKQQTLQIQQLQSVIEQQEKRYSQKQITLVEHSTKSIQQDAQLTELTEKNQKLSIEVEELKKQNWQKEQQIRQLNHKLKDLQQQNTQFIKINQEERNKFERDISVYKVLIQQAQGVIQDIQNSKISLQKDLVSCKQVINEKQKLIQSLRKQIIVEQSYHESTGNQFQTLTINFQHCRSELCQTEEGNQKLKEEINSLKDEIKMKKEQWGLSLEEQRMRLSRQVTSVRRQAELETSRVKKLDSSYSVLRQELTENLKKYEQQQKHIQMLQNQKQGLVSQYQQQLQKLSQMLERFQDRNEELMFEHRGQIQQLVKQIQNLNFQCIELNHHLVSKQTLNEQRGRIIEDLNLKLHDAQNQVIRCQNETTQLLNEKQESTLTEPFAETRVEYRKYQSYHFEKKQKIVAGSLVTQIMSEFISLKEGVNFTVEDLGQSQLRSSWTNIEKKLNDLANNLK